VVRLSVSCKLQTNHQLVEFLFHEYEIFGRVATRDTLLKIWFVKGAKLLSDQNLKTRITIEHFYLEHKIEKVKEFLIYDELNLTEIANGMHYNSVAHLSNQFKKMTGMTPS